MLAPGVLRIVIHEGRNRQVRRMCRPSAIPCGGSSAPASGRSGTRTCRPGGGAPSSPAEVRALAAAAGPGGTRAASPGPVRKCPLTWASGRIPVE